MGPPPHSPQIGGSTLSEEDGSLSGVVDFGDAVAADPRFDLARLAIRSDAQRRTQS